MPGSLRVWFFIGDLLLLNLSILLSLNIFGANWTGLGSSNIYLVVFSNLAWLFLVMVSTPYKVTKGWSLTKILRSQSSFIFIHLLVVASLVFFFRQKYSFFQIAFIYALFIPLFLIFRVVLLYLRKVVTSELPIKNYALIGKNELAFEVRRFYLVHPDSGLRFKGYLDLDNNEFSLNYISDFCVKNDIQEICCCVPLESNEALKNIVEFGLNSLIKVRIVSNVEGAGNPIQLDRYDSLPGKDLATISLDDPQNQFFKRAFDIVFSSLFIMLVMSWLLPVIAIAIKLDSRGPIFFVQLRSGRGNRPFKCFKFRSMMVNNAADSLQASKNDSRITKLGNFLRRTSIDELPQFFNVFLGTMSIVGPRPHMLKHTAEYSELIEHFMGRHYIKPGITGLAQCMGYRGETRDLIDMENRVRMDRYYIENWTFWFDVKIIFLTVIGLVRGSDKAF